MTIPERDIAGQAQDHAAQEDEDSEVIKKQGAAPPVLDRPAGLSQIGSQGSVAGPQPGDDDG